MLFKCHVLHTQASRIPPAAVDPMKAELDWMWSRLILGFTLSCYLIYKQEKY